MNEITIPTIWTKESYKDFANKLNTLKDNEYYKFNKKIVSTNYKMIGIRVPTLRQLAKQIKETSFEDYLKVSIPKTYEEIFLRGVVISYIKDYDIFIKYFKDYLKYIDNWAICDMVLSSCKIISKNKDQFELFIQELLSNSNEYYVRVGIIALLDYYIEKEKLTDLYTYLDNIAHEGYYVHMAISWIISILYIKYPKETEQYLKNNKLKPKTLNKAIQKIRESNRVSTETKNYLLKYKR